MLETQSDLSSSVDGLIKCILNDSGPEVAGQGDLIIQAGAPQRRDGSLSPWISKKPVIYVVLAPT